MVDVGLVLVPAVALLAAAGVPGVPRPWVDQGGPAAPSAQARAHDPREEARPPTQGAAPLHAGLGGQGQLQVTLPPHALHRCHELAQGGLLQQRAYWPGDGGPGNESD